MRKIYIEVFEEGTEWGITLGEPNADADHTFYTETSQKAYELRNKILDYLEEIGLYEYHHTPEALTNNT